MAPAKPRYKTGFWGTLTYSPWGLVVVPALYLIRVVFHPSEKVMACLVTGWLVGLIAYQHGVKEALRSVDRTLPPTDVVGVSSSHEH